jgi:hypothetical protein
MRFRKLRIAWSVIWTAVTLLLIGFWIHSYFDRVTFEVLVTPTHRYYLRSMAGCVVLDWEDRIFLGIELQRMYEEEYFRQLTTNAGVRVVRIQGTAYAICVSYWLLMFAAAFIAAMPWLSFNRFSLRTLLLATTLVAVVLGLVVWLG